MQTTDFDLAPKYDSNKQINPIRVKVQDSEIVGDVDDTYPDKHWSDNVGFKVEITVADGGSGYGINPSNNRGGGGTGATAKQLSERNNKKNRSNKCRRRIFVKSNCYSC